MRSLKLFASSNYWRYSFDLKAFFAAFLKAFGWLYVATKVLHLLAPDLEKAISGSTWLIGLSILLALGNGINAIWPKSRISCTLTDRDITLSIEVGDLFDTKAAVVIGTNRTFDTELGDKPISENSAQGQFTVRYYNRQHQHLDVDIAASLKDRVAGVPTNGKLVGKQTEYPIGTVAAVKATSPKGARRGYLVAIATLSSGGRASGTKEDLLQAMNALWVHVGEYGDIEPLRVPLLGTGYTRLTEQRSEIVHALIDSFVVACSERRFCEDLTIVISPHDYRKHHINLDELGKYLMHVCKYTPYRKPGVVGSGVAIS